MISISGLKAKIENQRNSLLAAIKRLRRDDPFSSTDRALIVEPGTDAADLFGHEQAVVLEGKLKTELKDVEAALEKIKKGTYGICERCHKKIEIRRLEVRPAAIYCLKCEKDIEAGTK